MTTFQFEQHVLNGEPVDALNAQYLWEHLQLSQPFESWITSGIEKYGFVEGVDFGTCDSIDRYKRGLPVTAYHVSIEMAKLLASVEGTDKGKEARQHLIEAERQAKAVATASNSMIPNPYFLLRDLRLELAAMQASTEQQRLVDAELDEVATAIVRHAINWGLEEASTLEELAENLEVSESGLEAWMQAKGLLPPPDQGFLVQC